MKVSAKLIRKLCETLPEWKEQLRTLQKELNAVHVKKTSLQHPSGISFSGVHCENPIPIDSRLITYISQEEDLEKQIEAVKYQIQKLEDVINSVSGEPGRMVKARIVQQKTWAEMEELFPYSKSSIDRIITKGFSEALDA